MKPKKDIFTANGKSLVSKIKVSDDLEKDVEKTVDLIGGFSKLIKKGDTVLLKPNFVYNAPFPATTSPDFLEAVINVIKKYKPSKILVGESSIYWQNTRRIMEKRGAFDVAERTGAEVYIFDDYDWQKVDIPNGKYQRATRIPTILDEVDRLIFLPNCKTHRLARFTMSLKLAFGCTNKLERVGHFFNLEPKIAEVASVIWPDLCIMDARKCFVTEGPDYGEVREPNLILASGDRIALDIEGIKIIKKYPADNLLNIDPWNLPTIKRAVELGIGAKSEKDYKVIEK